MAADIPPAAVKGACFPVTRTANCGHCIPVTTLAFLSRGTET
jgi:hypothetical protein